MSDNLRRYRAVRKALDQAYPHPPQGHAASRLNTLAALISGIVAAKRTSLPEIALKVPDQATVQGRERRYRRFLCNEHVGYDVHFMPFISGLIASLMHRPLVLVFDGSTVGRGGVTLMASLVYKGRALPLAWLVRTGKKGHFPEALHLELLAQVRRVLPLEAEVIFLGDGEFDGLGLLEAIEQLAWYYVCRTASNRVLIEDGERFRFDALDVGSESYVSLPSVGYSAQNYGPVHAILWHERRYRKPVYLITNMELAQQACWYYRKRFKIETFFSDQKSRGFHIHKSHISDPARLSRLLLASCLAYIWIVYLGTKALREGSYKRIHRSDRCDLSLFQLGLRLLEHLLNEALTIAVAFAMLPFDDLE